MADVVVTTNQSHKDIAIARGGKRPEDIYVVRSGPQLSQFAIYPPDPAWRQGKSHLLVYLGEICKQDGVDHLIRALKLLIDGHGFHDFHCVLIGGGPHQPVIQRYAQEIGVASHCTFTGRHPRRGALPHPLLGRHRHRPGSEERLDGQEHDEQDRRVHVLWPADRLL